MPGMDDTTPIDTTPSVDAIPAPLENPRPAPAALSIAPVWHTLVLMAGILLLSVASAMELSGKGAGDTDRMRTYGMTAITEVLMLVWVYFGLRLRKIPFRSLLGEVAGGFKGLAIDIGSAAVFWIGSLFVLATLGVMWTLADLAIHHRSLFVNGKPAPAAPSEQNAVHALTALVPGNTHEVIAWVFLCIFAGITEEIVFRGYFQRQFIAWSRGMVAGGVVFSAAMFGIAHGYQGARNMILLSIFGVLFSLLALFRKSLRAGIFAHAWHDTVAGLLLAILKSKHLL